MSVTLWTMFAVGIVLALAWSSVSQFLLPLRGAREFGLDRGGVSGLLMLAQLVDLLALLPVGRLADGLGRMPVLGVVIVVLGLGTAAVGLGSFPWFVAGCACFGFGLAGWMLPVGVIREHTRAEHLAWRMGLYRVGVDAAMFFGPFASGLLGECEDLRDRGGRTGARRRGTPGPLGYEPIAGLHARQRATARRRKNAGLAPLARAVGRWKQFSGRNPVETR